MLLLRKILPSGCIPLIIVAVALIGTGKAFGIVTDVEAPKWGMILMGLFGGLAMFLFGMDQMTDGVRSCLFNH